MGALTLLILRLVFLAVLWAFVFAVVYALRSDLFGQRVRKQSADAAPTPFSSEPFVATPLATPTIAPPTVAPPTEPIRRAPQNAPQRAPQNPAPATGGPARRLVITSGPKAGLEIELPSEQLAIGRSSESGLVIRDDYTSTHHARLMLWNDGWVVQDLDSTNGTFLDGARVTLPTPVPVGTPVTIGTTTFELRR
ncbi:MAG TPA: FHA domain-containing protein [Galbitalea sp.]